MSAPALDAAVIRALAASASPDPFLGSPGAPAPAGTWWYAPEQYERGLLHRLVEEGFAAGRNVHYAVNYARADPSVRLARRMHAGERCGLVVHGAARVESGAAALIGTPDGPALVAQRTGEVVLEIVAPEGEPAALRVEGAWRLADGVEATAVPGGDRAPHLDDEPVLELEAAPLGDGLFDAGATVLGRPVVVGDRPRIATGESIAEALDHEHQEARHDPVAVDGGWSTVHRLGFRYVHAPGAERVLVRANVRPSPRPGAFVSADPLLDRIWGTAAYTTRTCMQGLNLDGVKRDRMPWLGDQALGLIANAYAVGDPAIAAASLAALGAPTEGYINGLADYSLWWVVAQRSHARYLAAAAPPAAVLDAVHGLLEGLEPQIDERGVLRPLDLGHFAGAGPVLIDWGVRPERGRDLTALQVLLLWALESAAELLRSAGDDRAERWAAHAATLRATLLREAWSPRSGQWREYLDDAAGSSVYPAFLAVLAGLHDDGRAPAGLDVIGPETIRTPFMMGFALRALHLAGRGAEALRLVERLWAPMLEAGATTFWEEFPNEGESPYEMYGRPFGKSLCHAWGAAPASLLPEIVLGIRPGPDGWAEVVIDPLPAGPAWAAAVVPTPLGDLVVVADADGVRADAPPGMTVTVLRRSTAI